MMIRRFNPVGQGAFYSEHFDNYTVVYDCGSTSLAIDKSSCKSLFVEREIHNLFPSSSIIDKVFISHLHLDHVNGLKYLLKNYNVRQVYLPYLTPSQKIIHLVDLSISSNKTQSKFARMIIEDPNVIKKISRETEISLVLPDDPDLYPSDESNNVHASESAIRSGTPILNIYNSDWVYVPYTFCFKNREHQFLDELKQRNIEIDMNGKFVVGTQYHQISLFDSIQDSLYKKKSYSFDEIWADKILQKKISDAYAAVDGDINTSSMVIYSGLSESNLSNGMSFGVRENSLYGCLYLGDFDASSTRNWTEMREAYRDYWDFVHVCQIPHHGSAKSYNHLFVSELEASHYVISSGYNNRYRHPHASVLNDVIRSRKQLHVVTEHVGSAVSFTYSDI